MKVTNEAAGARGVNLKNGTTIWVEPGQSVDLDEAEVSHVHADLTSEAAGPPSLKGKTKAELVEIAKAEGVEVAEDATNAAITEAIEAKRAG